MDRKGICQAGLGEVSLAKTTLNRREIMRHFDGAKQDARPDA
jgi:hypothetical protein